MLELLSKIWKFLQGLFKSSPGSNSINFSNQGDVKIKEIKQQHITKNIYYRDTNTAISIETEEHTSKYEDIQNLFGLTLFLSICFGTSLSVLCSFLPFWKFGFTPIVIVLLFFFFNLAKYKIDSAVNLLCNQFYKLKALNFWTIAILDIDLNRKDHFPRVKNFVLLCLFTAIIVFNLIFIGKIILKKMPHPKSSTTLQFEY